MFFQFVRLLFILFIFYLEFVFLLVFKLALDEILFVKGKTSVGCQMGEEVLVFKFVVFILSQFEMVVFLIKFNIIKQLLFLLFKFLTISDIGIGIFQSLFLINAFDICASNLCIMSNRDVFLFLLGF